MAKRKKNRGGENVAAQAVPMGGERGHWDVGIRSAENGAVINISHNTEGKNPKYTSKTLVATSPRAAFRIAAAHCPAITKKGGKKKSGRGKRVASKSA
jgi:hypothetical protein